ncbi:hypothetical protein CcCBS67573_g04583 [Chytriomyces confervae]|uniref:Uncharacterized protein n=1 Tax=Chytriomyces confervae TaxID=246404 RepID=A0A507FFS5_9FUNG|nr:hypothetical protein CcCBS67573_g04583 [Chytriomyces confervae]
MHLQCQWCKYESCAAIFFSDVTKSTQSKGLYKPFMDCIRNFAVLPHCIIHGRLTFPSVRHGWGKTECPISEGNGENACLIVVKQMDGSESAHKRFTAFGGGNNHGHYAWAQEYWTEPGIDYVAEAKMNGKSFLSIWKAESETLSVAVNA